MSYQLRVCDLRSDQVLDILPIEGITYDDYIGKTGSLSASVPIPNRALAQRAKAALLPGRTMLYLERSTTFGTEIAWAGILWTRTPTMADRAHTLPIQAATIESWLREHRMLSITTTNAGFPSDQFDIVRFLVDYAQEPSGADLGIEIDYSQTSGVLRERTYLSYDLSLIGDLIDDLAACEGGFEWRVQVYRDADGTRHKALRLGYPVLSTGAVDLVLDSPGPILAYSLPEDATVMATVWRSRGASTNRNQAAASYPLMSQVYSVPGDIAEGWPHLDGSSDYSSVEVQATLEQHAAADLQRARRPVVIPSISYATAGNPLPQLGSTVRLRIQDDWYPEMHSARYRVVGLRVTPEERGRPETTELYLEAML